jgi:hypothetical protein
MKHIVKSLLFFICIFSFMGLSAAYASYSPTAASDQAKLYIDANNLEIADNVIYVHLEDNCIATKAVRADQYGCYIFESDITDYGISREKKWKCPYCHRWWPIGERCQNPECPTNKW